MASGYTVSGLTSYVEVNKDVLVKNLVLGLAKGDTIRNCRKQLGIKTKERLNYLDVDPALQDGSNCGFSASGSTVFSEREIETAQIKAQDQYCDKDLLGKFAEYQVKIAATKDAADAPFESELVSEVIEKCDEKMEKLVWQGDKNNGDLIDGFATIAAGADSGSTVMVTGASSTSIYNKVKAVIEAIPEEIIDKAVVFLSPANYRKLGLSLVEDFKYNADLFNSNIEGREIYFPGTEVRIHKAMGLKGSDLIYATAWENMVYGADLENDSEKVRFWYDDNSELFKYSIHWNAGVQTLYPDMVVLGDFSA